MYWAEARIVRGRPGPVLSGESQNGMRKKKNREFGDVQWKSGWWFGTFFFPYIGNNDPN